MNAFTGVAEGTLIRTILPSCSWSLTNVFHRWLTTLDHRLGENEDAQKTLTREQDGSEVRSVELERALAMGEPLWSDAPPSRRCATPRRRSTPC
ncbi:hypothetical protein [Acuticoccus sp.]|uniref:hypothetical protein n=1 Tax=Acuticoccus sp. TaxID=1904378 RepID=UPI003B516111